MCLHLCYELLFECYLLGANQHFLFEAEKKKRKEKWPKVLLINPIPQWMHSVTTGNVYCPLSPHPTATQLKVGLSTVNAIHINRLLSAARSRIQDGYIYTCLPLVSRRPRAFLHDKYQSFKYPHQSPFFFSPPQAPQLPQASGNLIMSDHCTPLPWKKKSRQTDLTSLRLSCP